LKDLTQLTLFKKNMEPKYIEIGGSTISANQQKKGGVGLSWLS
jgi:hypothetical protein